MASRGSVPKGVRAELDRLADLAFDRELGERLANVRAPLEQWEKHDIASSELFEYIDAVRDDARAVFRMYGDMKPAEIVARALAQRIIKPDEASKELRESLSTLVAKYSP